MHHMGTAVNSTRGAVNVKLGNTFVGMHDWTLDVTRKIYPEVQGIEDVKMSTGGYPASLSAPTISICDDQDPVCAFNWPFAQDISVHTSYGAEDYLLLGRRLAQLMNP